MKTQYQVLARKYRPKNFHELIGQDHVARALANAIDNNRLHHAYLFTGTRGVGKTTIARILSKCLNCETGVTSTPCGQCHVCRAIDEGQFIDLIEIDAASRTKVEDTRDLLENVPYAPTQGRFKVYLIDEVHMLSTHSFNALLKTLEEPPSHVKFLFATTDPQKLPITIVSRCLQFVLRPLPQELLVQHLQHILNLEHINYSESALWQLAAAGKGSVRDSLSLTDQAIAFGGGVIEDGTVSAMLGLINSTDVLDLLRDVYEDERAAVANHISTMRSKMVDAGAILDKLADVLHKLSIVQILPDVPLDMNDEDKKALMALSHKINAQTLQLYYDIIIKSRETLKFATTPMQGLEMAILRLLAFRPLSSCEYLLDLDNPPPNDLSAKPQAYTDNKAHPNDEIGLDEVGSDEIKPSDSQAYLNHNSKNSHQNDLQADFIRADFARADVVHEMVGDDSKQSYIHDLQNNTQDTQLHDTFYSDDAQNDGYDDYANDDNDLNDNHLNNNHFNDSCLDNDSFNDGTDVRADSRDDAPYALSKITHTNDDLSADFAVLSSSALNDSNGVHHETPTKNSAQTDGDVVSDVGEQRQTEPSNALATNALATKTLPTNALVTNTSNPPTQNIMDELLPAVCDLTQSWTDDKWDYWVSCAIERNLLSADEIALVQNAVICGDVKGAATLLVNKKQRQIEVSFQHLAPKILSDVGTALSLSEADVDVARTPAMRKQARAKQVVVKVQEMLVHSPVVEYLMTQGFLEDTAVEQTKLIGLTH